MVSIANPWLICGYHVLFLFYFKLKFIYIAHKNTIVDKLLNNVSICNNFRKGFHMFIPLTFNIFSCCTCRRRWFMSTAVANVSIIWFYHNEPFLSTDFSKDSHQPMEMWQIPQAQGSDRSTKEKRIMAVMNNEKS